MLVIDKGHLMMEVVSFHLMGSLDYYTWWTNPLKSRFKILTEVPIPYVQLIKYSYTHLILLERTYNVKVLINDVIFTLF